MMWEDLFKAINKAVSEYKQRNEPVPELLWKMKNWVEPKIKVGAEADLIDVDDLAQLFLQMAGWYH